MTGPCGMGVQGARAYAEAVGVYLAFAVDKGCGSELRRSAPGRAFVNMPAIHSVGKPSQWFGTIAES